MTVTEIIFQHNSRSSETKWFDKEYSIWNPIDVQQYRVTTTVTRPSYYGDGGCRWWQIAQAQVGLLGMVWGLGLPSAWRLLCIYRMNRDNCCIGLSMMTVLYRHCHFTSIIILLIISIIILLIIRALPGNVLLVLLVLVLL